MKDLAKVKKRKFTKNSSFFIQYQVESKYMFPWSSYDDSPTLPEEEVESSNHNNINLKQKENHHSILNASNG